MKKFVYSWISLGIWFIIVFQVNIGRLYAQSSDSLAVCLTDEIITENSPDLKNPVEANTQSATPLAANSLNYEIWFDFEILAPKPMSYHKDNKFSLYVQFEGESMWVFQGNVNLNSTSTTVPRKLNYRLVTNGKKLINFKTVSRNRSADDKREGTLTVSMDNWALFGGCSETVAPDDFQKQTPVLFGYNAKLIIKRVPVNPVLSSYPADHTLTNENYVRIKTDFSDDFLYRWDWYYSYQLTENKWDRLGASVEVDVNYYRVGGNSTSDFLDNVKQKRKMTVRAGNPCLTGNEKDNSKYAGTLVLDLKIEAPTISAYSIQVTPPKCAGGKDGQVKIPFYRKLFPDEAEQLTLTNLDDPLGYKPSITLRNEENFVIFTGLSAGRYEVKYTNGYILNSTIPSYIGDEYRHKAQFTVSDPPKLSLSGLNKTDVHCKGGSDGTITFTPTGGTGDIRAWYTTAASYPVTRDAVSVVPGLAAANYTVELRDANDCRMTDAAWKINIAQPATGVSLQELSKTDPRGYGLTDGAIEVIARGGTGGFTYSWQKNGQPVSGSGSKLTGLGDGRYKITVKDANYNKVSPVTAVNLAGCQSTVDIELRQPDLLSVSIGKTGDISCYGLLDGVLRATATGGVGGYRYEWYKSVGGSWAKLRYTTAEVSGLDAGVYRAFVFDRNDIKAVSANYTLTQPDPVRIAFKTAEPACYGGSDGRIEAVVTGGNGGYTYTWPGNPGTSSVIYGEAQNYVVKVKDRKDCRAENNVTIGQPARLTATAQVVLPASANASDGKITVSPSGGTPGYHYRWDYRNSVSNPLTGIPADSVPYRVVVKDAHDCRTELNPRVIYPLGVRLVVKKVISCKGDRDGLLEAMPEGGVSRYYRYQWYQWSNGAFSLISGNGKVSQGVGSGRYQVKVTDSENNTATAEITITEPPLLQATAQITLPSSAAGSDGRIAVSPSGGTPGYYYRWDYRNAVSNPLTGIPADSVPYRVVVKDAHDCRIELEPRVIYPLGVKLVVKKVISCKGDRDGLLEAMPEGGVSRYYRYQWFKSGNGGFQEIEGNGKISAPLEAGTYRVKVTDSENNSVTTDWVLTEPDFLTAVFTVDIPSGPTVSDGKITVFPAGGTPYTDGSYRYFWDYRNSVSNPLTDLPADSVPYRVVVKDAHQCEIELNPRILYPLMVGIREKQPVSCYGRTDGRLEALAEGGVSSIYFYKWYKRENDGFREIAGEESVSEPLGDGIYRVEVRDSEHNQAVSQEFIFRQPDSLRLKFGHLDPLCKDDRNGWINALVEGGTEPYNYLWEDKTDFDAFNRSNLACGFYKVTVTDSHGCQLTGRDTLTEPDSLLVTHEVRFPSVFNGTDGTIRLFPKGGTEPYRYEWTYNHSTDNPLAGLAASDTPYEVTVTDAHGCTVSDTPRMYNPLIVEIQVRDSISCYGRLDGRLAAVFAGGVGAPHDFEWFKKDREGHFRKTGTNDSILYGVADGEYRVSVRDRSDSLAVSDVFVFRHPDSLQLQFRHHFPLCKHDANGWTEALADGGTTPYRYYWEDIDREDAALRSGLEDGVYKAVVTDRRGCVVSATDTLTEPDSLIVRHKVDFPSVYGGDDGMVAVSPEGGTKPYRYAWDYNHSVANPLTGLSAMADPLHVVVTDAHGCQVVDSVRMYNPITIELEESGVIICSGQTNAELTAHVKGGAGRPYRFEWYFVEEDLLTGFTETDSLLKSVGVGTYRVAAFDSVGNLGWSADYTIYSPDSLRLEFEIGHLPCKYDRKGWIQAIPFGGEAPYRLDWFDGSADTRIEHLEEGRYEVKLTDKRGCFVTKKVKINSPDELLLSMDYRQPLGWQRDDGMIWVTPVGGTQPYRYEWHGWENDRDTLEGIPAGNYTVTVTDSHQCNKSISATVTEPSLLEVTVSCVRIISCYGVPDGILRATACGGVGNYRYDWYRLSGRHADFIVSGINCEQLPAGEYKVKVTDGNGITAWSEVYRLVQPELLQAAVTVSALLCKGDTDGKAGAVVNGGTLPYEYIWTNGARTGEIDSLSEGRYLVAVKDAHGCRTEAMGTVVSPDALEVSSKVTDPVCNGGKGSVVLQISGGTGKYRITWADGNSRMKREDLPAGSYPVDVADANGCLWQGVFELFEPEQVNVSLGPERTLCREQEVELRPLNVERITGYKWLKDNEAFSSQPVIRVTEAGTYRLEVVTKKGCRGNGEVTIGKSDAEIDANFAMASEIEAEDILKVVNTCLPMPEYCEWIFPETGTITIVSDDRDMAELIFDRPGEYTIGLRSVEGKCEEFLYKNVSVVTEGSGQPVTRGPERVIRDVLVWPNPSNGHFRVRVKLNRKSDGLLRLYALTGVLLRESKCRGDESYELSFNESLPPGIYILHLIFGPEREAVKVAVE